MSCFSEREPLSAVLMIATQKTFTTWQTPQCTQQKCVKCPTLKFDQIRF